MGRMTAILLTAAVTLWVVAAIAGKGAEWVAALGLLCFLLALLVGFTGAAVAVVHWFTRPRARHSVER